MGFSYLARIYADAVKRGERTIDKVPAQIKSDVEKLVNQK